MNDPMETITNARLSDERYRAFIESVNDGVYETDIYGNFTYFNNALCKVFRYPAEELQGKNFSEFMDRKNAKRAYDAFTKIWITHRGFSDIIWEIIDKNGETRIIELSGHLIKDETGKKRGFRGIARDVTDKFRAQGALKESQLQYQQAYEASRRAENRARILLDFTPYPMVVTRLDGKVVYLNPAFSETFGWSLEELREKTIPFIPPDYEQETKEGIKRLFKENFISRVETRRLTKDGRILDVIMRVAVYPEEEKTHGGELVILRDITREKRIAQNNDALLRVSTALPAYPDLEDLMDYITKEIKQLLHVEGAFVILLDEESNDLFFQGASYDDTATQTKVKKVRFPASRGITGKVIRTGEPVVVHDVSRDPDFYPVMDEHLGYHTRSLLEVPLRSGDRVIGVLCALNKKEGLFDQSDIELLNMLSGTVALSIENARFSDELKTSYREVTSLNRAKDRVINHLSHELKTPVSVLLVTLNILSKKLTLLPEVSWKPTIERAKRNLERILEIQYQVEDIMRERHYKTHDLLTHLLDQCTDELEVLVAEEVGEGSVIERIRNRIDETFGLKGSEISDIDLGAYVQGRLKALSPQYTHRQVEIISRTDPTPPVSIPQDVMKKIFDGLIKNAIENTPDEGTIEVTVRKRGEGAELIVHDYGIGITEENQRRIFDGFFTTQETMAYSSKRPFDFNAGGKGADLLRMKIFSERYHFGLNMESSRCNYIPKDSDLCPGKISLCAFCKAKSDCHKSGGTTFTVSFP
ncbi:MAG: PAS domain S-box protein [Pseudomonadota bacterium]